MPRFMRTVTGAILTATLAACVYTAGGAASESLRGTATYLERIALPPNAVLEVKLVDVSRMDAPAVTISSYKAPVSAVPANWQMSYEARAIEANHSYALEARITSGSDLMFITTTHNPVFTGAPDKTDLTLQRAGN